MCYLIILCYPISQPRSFSGLHVRTKGAWLRSSAGLNYGDKAGVTLSHLMYVMRDWIQIAKEKKLGRVPRNGFHG